MPGEQTQVERRRHRMFVTQNTEYHFRDRQCVAVRDRSAGRWSLNHRALNRKLTGAIRYAEGEAYPSLDPPQVGDALFFADDGPDVITSVLTAIERPTKELVEAYPL